MAALPRTAAMMKQLCLPTRALKEVPFQGSHFINRTG